MKKYDIYISPLDQESATPNFGVEIQPKIGKVAARGVCDYLTYSSPDSNTNDAPMLMAVMTRNDEVGTALVMQPNPSWHNNMNANAVAEALTIAMDPANILPVKMFELHLDEAPQD